MNIQGTDIQILKNWCTALENQIKRTNEELKKKEPIEKQLFILDEKQKEDKKQEEEPASLRKNQRADILKNILLLINFDKGANTCEDNDVLEIIKQVRALIDVAENDQMDSTGSKD